MKKLLTVALIMGTQFACAGSKLRRILTGSASSTAIEVIVRFTYPPTKRDLNLLGSYGQVKKHLDIINGVDLALSLDAIRALRNNPTAANRALHRFSSHSHSHSCRWVPMRWSNPSLW